MAAVSVSIGWKGDNFTHSSRLATARRAWPLLSAQSELSPASGSLNLNLKRCQPSSMTSQTAPRFKHCEMAASIEFEAAPAKRHDS